MKSIFALALSGALLFSSAAFAAEPESAQKTEPTTNTAPRGDQPAQQKTARAAIGKGELLDLNTCVFLALGRHPSLAAARGTVAAGESRTGQAQANYFPQISASGSYSRIKSAASASSGRNLSSDPFDQYTAGASLTQMIFDFGKTPAQVRIQGLSTDASRSDYDSVRDQIILAVKQAYYGTLQAQKNLEAANENVRSFEHHLEQARGFFEVGVKPKFDVTKAEVDLSNARVNRLKAGNALKISRITLNNAMGMPDAPEYSVRDDTAVVRQETALSEVLETAFKNRPDYLASTARMKAAEESIGLAQKGYFPVISGNAAWNKTGEDYPRNEGWNAGVAVTVPIFSGFFTKHQVSEARAQFDVAQASREVLRQSIVLEVQSAYMNLVEARERIPTAELTVKQAAENLEIANGRYAAGVGNPIEVTDAQVSYTSAKVTYNQAVYDYNVAYAALQKASGIRYYAQE